MNKSVQVSKEEFAAFLVEHNLTADGFKTNGGYVQTKWLDKDGHERARMSTDSFGTIYEVEGEP